MRFCFFTSANSLQGGAERSMVRIVEHLLSAGHYVCVVLPFESDLTGHYRRLGADVRVMYWRHLQQLADPLHVLRYLFWLPIITFRLWRLLRSQRIALVHVNEILDFQALVAARAARVPAVTYCRIILPARWIRRVLSMIVLCLADRVICVSRAVHRLAFFNSSNPKIRVIYNAGPDQAVFNPAHFKPSQPNISGGPIVMGMVAKLVREKGHLLMLELMDRLRSRGYANLKCVIVGGSVPGHESYAEQLRGEIVRLGLDGIVELIGEQRDVPSCMAAMDIICHLPLVEDCFPAVPMEATMMGKPVLSFVSGGIPEQLTHPVGARLVEIGDMDSLVSHACELLDDPELRERIGCSGREEVIKKFSAGKHFSELEGVYAKLLSRPGRARRRVRVMRVLHSLNIGGVERQAMLMIERLRKYVDVDLVTLAGAGEVEVPRQWAGVTRFSLGCDHDGPAAWRMLRTVWRLRRLIERRRPDVIHCSLVWGNLLGMLAGLLAGRRVWVMTHGEDVNLLPSKSFMDLRNVARCFYRLCRPRLFTTCTSLARFNAKLLGVDEKKISLVPNSVAIPKDWRCHKTEADVRLVMTGRLIPCKRHDMAIKTVDYLARRGGGGELLIAGDGPLRAQLEQQAQRMGLSDRVRLLGGVADIPALLRTCDILLQPSTSEGFSNSILEAMASGLAVVGSTAGGIEDIQSYVGTLTLVAMNDQAALDEAVERFVSDSQLHESAGLLNRRRVTETLSADRIAQQWLSYYGAIVD